MRYLETQAWSVILPNFGSMFHNVLYHYAKVVIECWMPTASKFQIELCCQIVLIIVFKNIFKDYQNYKPKPDALNFSKKYLDNFRNEVVKPVI